MPIHLSPQCFFYFGSFSFLTFLSFTKSLSFPSPTPTLSLLLFSLSPTLFFDHLALPFLPFFFFTFKSYGPPCKQAIWSLLWSMQTHCVDRVVYLSWLSCPFLPPAFRSRHASREYLLTPPLTPYSAPALTLLSTPTFHFSLLILPLPFSLPLPPSDHIELSEWLLASQRFSQSTTQTRNGEQFPI